MRFNGFDKESMEEDGMLYEEEENYTVRSEEFKEEKMKVEKEKTEKLETDPEIELLKIYLNDLKYLPPVGELLKKELMQKASNGDREASKQLAEIYLMQAVSLAAKYRGRGVGLADLIQEANVGLMEAMLEEQITEESILASIENALEHAVAEESRESDIGEQIAARLNILSDAAKELADRHGKEPTAEELAEYLHMTVDEVKRYMKLSLDVLGAEDF